MNHKIYEYFAKKTLAFGLTFDSKWEAERWGQLKAMEKAGVVTQLERQIKYDLSIFIFITKAHQIK